MRRIFWTWDIRMRWTHGFCFWSESYLENYRRLIDVSAALGVEGIIIWGFLRDVHGGIDSAKKLVEYANKRNVKIYPGIGIDDYGGIYCEGDSHYSLDTFLKSHPEMQAIRADGSPDVTVEISPLAIWDDEDCAEYVKKHQIHALDAGSVNYLV